MQYNINALLAADSPDNNELAFHLMQHTLNMEPEAALDLIFNLHKRCRDNTEVFQLLIGKLKIEFRFENPLYMAQRGHKILMCFCYRGNALLYFEQVKEHELNLDFDSLFDALSDIQLFLNSKLYPRLLDWLAGSEEG